MKKRLISVAFILLFLLGATGIALSMLCRAGLKPGDAGTFLAGLVGLLAAWIVWSQSEIISRQVQLLRQQLELQAIIELDKEWNSPEMLAKRRRAWNSHNKPDIDRIEGVLEFLEKVSTFEKKGVISADLIWDTFGWYVSRYHHYCKDVIKELRKKWVRNRDDKTRMDPTLYMDFEALADELLKQDLKQRNERKVEGLEDLTLDNVKKEFEETRIEFINLERG